MHRYIDACTYNYINMYPYIHSYILSIDTLVSQNIHGVINASHALYPTRSDIIVGHQVILHLAVLPFHAVGYT